MANKLVHNTKTSLAEEAKQYVPKIRELYPNLDDMLVDRISKYCVVYSDGPDDGSIRNAILRFEQIFEQELDEYIV